jgi:uncharacterized protein (TIGR02145 family)
MKKRSCIYTLFILGIGVIFISGYRQIDSNATVTDYDGNVYHTVTIGTQTWMKENLKNTHYRNGEPIVYAPDDTKWFNLCAGATEIQSGAFCNYDNDANNATMYGRLYNGNAVKDSRNICPVGWHIPTTAEWKALESYLGGAIVAGGKMKEASKTHWISPNIGADNTSGFSGVPGGFRFRRGEFGSIGFSCYLWSSGWTRLDGTEAGWFRLVSYSSQSINHNDYSEASGFSIRCIKDN